MDHDLIRQIVRETVRELLVVRAIRPIRMASLASALPHDAECYLNDTFAGEHAGYIFSADLGALLKDVLGRSIPPNQYGKIMIRLGFESVLRRLNGKPQRIWSRGPWPSPRYVLQWDGNGRLVPLQQIYSSIPPLLVPPLPY